jgi:hypothetical protein
MHRVITQRLAGLGLAALMTVTAAGGTVAVFASGGPGENLSPVGDAAVLIDITQVSNTILWSSMAGNVSTVRTTGWPSSDGLTELGGALTMERPANPLAGAINIGEKPMQVEFELGG